MNKKDLIHLLLLLLLAAFLSSGCAHKPAASSGPVSPNSRLHQDRQVTTAKAKQAPTDSDMESAADSDFFDDEFEKDKVTIADPLYHWNLAMFHLNDKLYFCVLKPLAVLYKELTPDIFRTGVKNFFRNITAPIRLVNCVLQGKREAFAVELTRFVLNTTVGVLGLGSPADDHPKLGPPDEEDLGQTLAKYGLGNGLYIIWPVLGPSTLRDSIGMTGDFFLNPVSHVDPWEDELALKGFEKVNKTSFQIGTYEALKKAAIDPYTALRDVYLQFRKNKVQQ
ncbi:MAG: VacJ family lipoprotein [Desulfobacterales bacterium]|uniref:VacJ family lipoprotein n=1 Tax=Candidatus Desulfatibia profunda TaxID=2841695 RepID=A0A8J6TKZ2_9BACT|nr:VacJ family lipoprotein [Candidatus Desulfatibia profunda]MBL7180348.1 VacJ family lipoprotein [Desulfobacterales bacterium]